MKKKKEAYTIQLDPEFVEKIDKLADKIGVSRSQFMGSLLQSAYDDAYWLDRLDLLTATRALVDLKEKYFPKIKKAKEEEEEI